MRTFAFYILNIALVFITLNSSAAEIKCSQTLTSKTIIIVDGYSSGNMLAPRGLELGAKIYHIQTQDHIAPILEGSYKSQDYTENMLWSDPNTLTKIRSLKPDLVIAGSENGVPVADQINHTLMLPYRNSLSKSEARRNKYVMQETIKKAGIRAIPQILTNKTKQALKFAESLESWPVVVKPYNSAATEGVFFCNSLKEVEEAFNSILGKFNALGHFNDKVLVQKFIEGPEYVVNTVSLDGKAVVSDIWLYHKTPLKSGVLFYDYDELLPYHGKVQSELVTYAKRVLKALEITNGPAHFEIKYDKDGPVLIEVGARPYGGGGPKIAGAATGRNQSELVIDSFLSPESFKQMPEAYTAHKKAVVIQIRSERVGKLNLASFEQLKKIPGFYRLSLAYKEGELVPETENLFNTVGSIELLHANDAVIQKGLAQIKKFIDSHEFLTRD